MRQADFIAKCTIGLCSSGNISAKTEGGLNGAPTEADAPPDLITKGPPQLRYLADGLLPRHWFPQRMEVRRGMRKFLRRGQAEMAVIAYNPIRLHRVLI
jgi:hypothetical protein